MDLTSANLRAVTRGFRTLYDDAFQAAEPDWPALAMRTSSGNAEEVYGWLGAVPSMRKLVGEAVIQNLAKSDFTIKNEEFESTVAVKQSAIEQDRVGIYAPMFSAMGAAARTHPDELVGDLLRGGFTSKDYTGKNFFDTDKPHEPGNNRSAKFSNKGTKRLSPTTFGEGKANLKARTNGAGRSMKLGKKLLLVVPPELEDTARRILIADEINGSTNIQKGSAELKVFPELAGTGYWFLMETGLAVKALIVQIEKEPVLAALDDPESEKVMLQHEFLYQAYARHNAGYGLSQLIFGSTGVDPAPEEEEAA